VGFSMIKKYQFLCPVVEKRSPHWLCELSCFYRASKKFVDDLIALIEIALKTFTVSWSFCGYEKSFISATSYVIAMPSHARTRLFFGLPRAT
jgi:hypothetical protein